ncbi:MAG: multicopper oxidase domain-containing protein [Nitrosopumilaceae archaeon]|nr:multicopper oxidase domain-containing protein [Nitrosopumilaceae archaeon]NIU02334.1 multicopper oxidase domain-containing protein [Nitrosopumilaceae archaeon]NIU88789.1 multicopper oxidase domain-containing protein [Nitrosopumilaceae archaeon]NIV66916.1 multicopper oxidase domain-containing protein [Nitrosopumilaceae archaeon]NIX62935.1 multicopper oxidase domain-containing protein [Nitrosopumilaceae archaeon]
MTSKTKLSSILIASVLISSVMIPTTLQGANAQLLSANEHGYAGPEALAAHADNAPVKRFTLIADEDESGTILPTGDKVHTMTFNGSIPAPTLRVTEGDVVQITIVNEGDEVHSIDQHASQITAVPNFGAVQPGDQKTYTFVAANPGVFAYHCEANDVFGLDAHALLGMEGMLIVDPKEGYQPLQTETIEATSDPTTNVDSTSKGFGGPAKEFALVYSESYFKDGFTQIDEHGDGDHSEHVYDKVKMMSNDPTYTHANGVPFGYLGTLLALPEWQTKTLGDVIPGEFLLDCTLPASLGVCEDLDGDGTDENNVPLALTTDPGLSTVPPLAGVFGSGTIATHIDVNAGDHARFFIQNTGDRQVAWHIVGEQLDRVKMGENTMTDSPIQTWNVGPYQDATIDVVFEQPGVYAIVNHDYSSLFKGQASIVVAHAPSIDPESCAEDDLVCNVIAGEADNVPSNAIPPMSELEDTSIDQTGLACDYGIGSVTDWAFTTECDAL